MSNYYCCRDNCCQDCTIVNEEFVAVTEARDTDVTEMNFEEVIICPICKEPNTSHMDNWICS